MLARGSMTNWWRRRAVTFLDVTEQPSLCAFEASPLTHLKNQENSMTQVMGIKHLRDGTEVQSVTGADMSTAGFVGTAPFANAALFPLNEPVLVRTDDRAMRAALGSTGTIVDALAAVSAQLEDSTARCVVVRVEDDEDPSVVIANIIGNEALRTGMWALLDAPQKLGITPRLIDFPGYTSQTENGVSAVNVTNGGSGYTANFSVTATGGDGSGFAGTAVVADGAVSRVLIKNPGRGYATVPTIDLSAGDGNDATATAALSAVGNQICANAPTILSRLKAKFMPSGPTSSAAAWLTWKESLPRSENIVHPIRQDVKVSVDGEIVTKPLSPYLIGLYIRVDGENDGVPSHSIANQSINGIVGITPVIDIDITSDGTEGMTLLEQGGGLVLRGETGVDGSLTDGGFVFWGTDTLSDDTQWQFANVVRLRDYIEINQIKAIRKYLGKFNLTLQTVQAVYNTMDAQLSNLRADGHLIDYRITFEADQNQPSDLRLGFLDITFRAEEPAPLRKVTIHSRRYADALTALVQNISIQLGSVAV